MMRILHEHLQVAAYYRYLYRIKGGLVGDALGDWLEAENQFFCEAEAAAPSNDFELGVVYASRPDDADDLQQIKGIGAVLESHLNEHGVYRLAQIASWTPEVAEAISARIGFRGRVEREDWIGQARQLLSGMGLAA